MFEYKPLRRAQFEVRLFKIVPAFERRSKLRLILSTHTLKNVERFVALSYTWDRPNNQCPPSWDDEDYKEEVLVDGKTFLLRPNLKSLLIELRGSKDKHMHFFADAVSINQNDELEKADQIIHMGDIYARATHTLIWLGPEHTYNPAVDSILELAKAWLSRPPEERLVAVGPSYYNDHLQFMQREIRDAKDLDAVEELLTRSYWSRVWIVQEILSSKEVYLFNNGQYLKWSALTAMIQLLGQHCAHLPTMKADKLVHLEQAHSKLQPLVKIADSTCGFGRVHAIYGIYTWSRKTPSLAALLTYMQPLQSKIAKDKVYAALGLTVAGPSMTADYNGTDRQVFEDVVVHCITSTGSLQVLDACDYPRTGLPSWVPDWSHESIAATQIPPDVFRDNGCSGGHAQPDVTFSDHVMTITGKQLQLITEVHQDCSTAFWKSTVTIAYIGQDPATKKHELLLVTHETGLEFRQTADYTRTCCITDTYYVNSQEPRYRAYVTTLSHDLVLDYGPNVRIKHEHFGNERPGIIVSNAQRQKKLIETEDGYFALVPSTACVGDWIVLIQGGDKPLVLRPSGNAFNLIGSCYVHGVMDGEAWQNIPDSELQRFEIV